MANCPGRLKILKTKLKYQVQRWSSIDWEINLMLFNKRGISYCSQLRAQIHDCFWRNFKWLTL
ncbi:MAG: hypothetical protein HC849_28115 [Oscillatoriales cyanobacterium RU_3_3]|nr:hypothetical protein [Microcoleus sp. SU_5_6]NJL65821.1 hypothetical protein [Microcoleus sp. SM1_3_4]NJM63167.1 hypothetical protein [Oscillatoriales cyanobacterium RU_3_3]NJR21087.1 hypothetical protein [Richelia sp. CSU_2_1]